jgi:hypothetical protein
MSKAHNIVQNVLWIFGNIIVERSTEFRDTILSKT